MLQVISVCHGKTEGPTSECDRKRRGTPKDLPAQTFKFVVQTGDSHETNKQR